MNYRLQNASRAFQANKWILCDENVSIALRLKFFDAMVTSVLCFAAGHRKVYVGALRKLCYGAWLDRHRISQVKSSQVNSWNAMDSIDGRKDI